MGTRLRTAGIALGIVVGALPLMAADCAADVRYDCHIEHPNPNRLQSICENRQGTQHRPVAIWPDGMVIRGPWTANRTSLSDFVPDARMGQPHQEYVDHA